MSESANQSATTKSYRVEGMDCAHCAVEVETGVAKLNGVRTVEVNFATGLMRLDGDVAFDVLQTRVQALGKSLVPPHEPDAPAPEPEVRRGGVLGFWDYLLARRETQLAVGGGALVLFAFVLSLVGLPDTPTRVLYVIGMLITMQPILKSGINTLRINHEFGINLLMSIAAVGAILIGEYLEGATVIFLFAIGEALEGYTADRARDSIRGLMALKPTQAVRLRGEREEMVPVAQLAVDDVLLVKPGENIPMDGTVIDGASGVNQAPITGESLPVAKVAGDDVFAGAINGEGALTMRVTRLAADNTLSRIIQMVEEAQSVRAPSQRFIDRFAHYYTPAVVVMALAVAALPPLVFGAPFLDAPDERGWLYRALSMLVIACPCALVISTPVTVISAITRAARRGVLIKGGAFLEQLGTIKAFAFDKTGTLTRGKPAVTEVHAADCTGEAGCPRCDDVLALASAVERRASHPLAAAVVRAAESRHLDTVYAPAEAVETLAGRGVRGTVDGKLVTVGSHSLFDAEFPHPDVLCAQVSASEAQGRTTMLLSEGAQVRGFVALADEARASSRAVIAELNAMDLPTVMLTGDNAAVAQAVGAAVGVTEVRAGLLPQDKVEAIKALRAAYGGVAMVGDGVNDTPALAAATIGIAMGGAGSPQALETADVALMADDLSQLPFAVRLSHFARRLITQNVVLSFGMKAVFLVLALFGLTTLWLAIFADVGMALIVTLNGMRPLRFERDPDPAA
ncbi:heavy metal translocating P-type ATPase [Aggregatilinea lenta]|uniref:heavy metal translocating P-type ATPase n=1 Tax=Aggregatilinea lenta TaxID=913108 RepID=UPI000E5B3B67|nr:heavy metal translocating P-type ATPase [Aggregatilinea lenta]